MADTCSIDFQRVNRQTHEVEVSKLWQDLKREFKGDRKKAIAHYELTKDSEFIFNNLGKLKLDAGGEITMESLKKVMDESRDFAEEVAMDDLNDKLRDNTYSYLEALDAAIRFNNDEFYTRRGEKSGKNFYQGLMAKLHREANGRYSLEIVQRTRAEEDAFAKHVQNKLLTDALVALLQNHGMDVRFLEDSQARVWFDPVNADASQELMQIASVLQGEESSVEVAEVVGHFLVQAVRQEPLVERLVQMFSATEEDVRKGKAKMTGEEAQQTVFKSGDASTNPFYREDYDVSNQNVLEAVGIVVGRQLIDSVRKLNRDKNYRERGEVPGKYTFRNFARLIRRLGVQILKLFNFMKKEVAHEMIQQARNEARKIVDGYIESADNEKSDFYRGKLRKRFEKNNENLGASVYISKRGIAQLSERAQKSVKAYTDAVEELKVMAGEIKSLLRRADQRPENKQMFEAIKEILQKVRARDSKLNMESFAESMSREGVALILVELSDVLTGPVAKLLDDIKSISSDDTIEKTVKDFASMRNIITIYRQAASLYNSVCTAQDDLHLKDEVKVDGQPASFTLDDALKMLGDILGTANDSGLPKAITDVMNSMMVNWAKEFYGQDYIDMGAAVLWPWEADSRTREKHKGRFTLIRRTAEEGRFNIADFAKTLEQDLNYMDYWIFSAADSKDIFQQLAKKHVQKANMLADRQAADWWYRLENMRPEMERLFGTTDCRIFFELNDEVDEFGNKMTGNLICAGLTEEQSHMDGILYGKWEAERRAFEKQLKIDFRNHMEKKKQEFYANPDNKHQVYYVSDMTASVMYQDFVAPQWQKWHAEHSVKDKVTNAWIPNPELSKYHNPQFQELFVNHPLGKERLAWYRQLLSIKDEMDKMLPAGATVNVRAPQIIGNLRHRYLDLRSGGHTRWQSFRGAVLKEMGDGVHIRPDEAYMFGTNNEFNDIGEDPLENQMYFEKDKRQRIAFWGVNRLHDTSNINTDLFSTLANYGGMAATYGAMSSVVDVAELGKEVLSSRQYKRNSWMGKRRDKQKRGTETRVTGRYLKWLENNVYGLNVTPPKFNPVRVALKLLQGFSRRAVKFMLNWNIPSGTINASTGLIEVFKEAGAGEHFSKTDLAWAMNYYFGHVFQNWGETLKGRHLAKMDKLSLLIRHFDMLGDNKAFFKSQKYDKGLIASGLRKLGIGPNFKTWLRNAGMSLYTMGEHMMQTIPQLAMLKSLEYWVESADGKGLKKVSMIDLYDFKGSVEGLKEDVDIVSLKKGTLAFLSRAEHKNYKAIQEALIAIDEMKGSANHRPQANVGVTLSENVYDRLSKMGVIIPGWDGKDSTIHNKYSQIVQWERALKKRQKKCTFNEDTELDFLSKAMNITDHLHGLYKTQSQSKFQQEWWTNLVSRMMGYLFGMITHRFKQMAYNIAQEKNDEGYLNTALKTYIDIFVSINNPENRNTAVNAAAMSGFGTGTLAHTLAFFDPLTGIILSGINLAKFLGYSYWNRKAEKAGGGLKDQMLASGYAVEQYRNIRRCAYTYSVMSILTIIKALLSPKFTDDDDNPIANTELPVNGMLYYWATRVLQEQAAFNTILGFKDETSNWQLFLPATISGGAEMLGIYAMGGATLLDKAIHDEPEWDRLYYKNGRSGQYEAGDSKAWVKFMRRSGIGDILYMYNWAMDNEPLLYPGRTTNVMFNGYQAVSSLEYGRKLR